MTIKTIIQNWIAVSNAYDTDGYLEKYHKEAVLDDPSVGRSFVGYKVILDEPPSKMAQDPKY